MKEELILKGYEYAKAQYAAQGVDVDAAIAKADAIPVSMHCWQGDDVIGFDGSDSLSGGIQTTGNYPGRARTADELRADIAFVRTMIPGATKLNLHASYAEKNGKQVDRDAYTIDLFQNWVDFAKEKIGLDFNPTYFAHPKMDGDFSLSSTNPAIRKFWIEHGKACIRISQYFAEETGVPCVMNIWTGDGFKDVPADRMGPRMRYKQSIEEILSEPFDKNLVKPCVESKVFGIGVESFTAGSAEFTLSFAATHDGCLPLMDNGHYHPTEVVSDKIPALLCFYPEIALHITRGVRWDSDHVLLLDDETKEMAKEIVRNDALDRVYMALDYFDASINRIAAWVVGVRSWKKALLSSMCTPNAMLKDLQDNAEFTKLMVLQEEMKTLPFGAVWAQFCEECGVASDLAWFEEIEKYEKDVLSKRN